MPRFVTLPLRGIVIRGMMSKPGHELMRKAFIRTEQATKNPKTQDVIGYVATYVIPDSKSIFVGIGICSPDDIHNFQPTIGKKIAEGRCSKTKTMASAIFPITFNQADCKPSLMDKITEDDLKDWSTVYPINNSSRSKYKKKSWHCGDAIYLFTETIYDQITKACKNAIISELLSKVKAKEHKEITSSLTSETQ